MIYNQDDDENVDFLSDKRVEEVKQEEYVPRRRGGAYVEEETKEEKKNKFVFVEPRVEEEPKKVEKVENEDDEEETDKTFTIILVLVAVVVLAISLIIMIKVFSTPKSGNTLPQSSPTNQTTNTNQQTNTNTSTNNNKKEDNKTNNSTSNSLTVTSSDSYDAYPVKIESVVLKQGGNFYNNTEKISGDKLYVEYKQISGLKDAEKEKKVNELLKTTVENMCTKNYLSDSNVLFIDITTKLSVNFNTISYIVTKKGEDIEGEPLDEEIKCVNIKLEDMKNIEFEELFTDSANIKNLYSSYVKGKVKNFYFTPKAIYVYDDKMKETKIDIANNTSSIALYKRFNTNTTLFKNSAKSQKVFTILDSNVSETYKDRNFKTNTVTKHD